MSGVRRPVIRMVSVFVSFFKSASIFPSRWHLELSSSSTFSRCCMYPVSRRIFHFSRAHSPVSPMSHQRLSCTTYDMPLAGYPLTWRFSGLISHAIVFLRGLNCRPLCAGVVGMSGVLLKMIRGNTLFPSAMIHDGEDEGEALFFFA